MVFADPENDVARLTHMTHLPAVPTGTSVALSIAESTPSVVAEVPVAKIPITVPVPISAALPVPPAAATSVEDARRQRSVMHPRMRKKNLIKSRLWMEIFNTKSPCSGYPAKKLEYRKTN